VGIDKTPEQGEEMRERANSVREYGRIMKDGRAQRKNGPNWDTGEQAVFLWSAVIHHRFAFGFAFGFVGQKKEPKRRSIAAAQSILPRTRRTPG
jgi:hypothetical protein